MEGFVGEYPKFCKTTTTYRDPCAFCNIPVYMDDIKYGFKKIAKVYCPICGKKLKEVS